jgi:hypothetical protein
MVPWIGYRDADHSIFWWFRHRELPGFQGQSSSTSRSFICLLQYEVKWSFCAMMIKRVGNIVWVGWIKGLHRWKHSWTSQLVRKQCHRIKAGKICHRTHPVITYTRQSWVDSLLGKGDPHSLGNTLYFPQIESWTDLVWERNFPQVRVFANLQLVKMDWNVSRVGCCLFLFLFLSLTLRIWSSAGFRKGQLLLSW